jgi:hypothetical protein
MVRSSWTSLLPMEAMTWLVAVAGLLSGGCQNPSVQEAEHQIATAQCQRLQVCGEGGGLCLDEASESRVPCPDGGFAAAYPAGVDQCVRDNVGAVGGSTDPCSQDQLDTCTNDIKSQSCEAANNTDSVPPSCQKCL